MPLPGESILRVEQGFNATEQLSDAIAFGNDGCYAENFGERFAKKGFKHREDHHGRFRHADAKTCGNFYSVRNRHAKVQNSPIRLAGFRFMNCYVAVNSLPHSALRMA